MPTYKMSLAGGLSPELVDRLHLQVLAMGHEVGVSATLLPIAALVIEEICTNIMEHSGATSLEVTLGRYQARVVVQVVDNGQAFNPCEAIVAQGNMRLEDVQERRLGLYMVKELSRSVRCKQDVGGLNWIEFDFDTEAPAEVA